VAFIADLKQYYNIFQEFRFGQKHSVLGKGTLGNNYTCRYFLDHSTFHILYKQQFSEKMAILGIFNKNAQNSSSVS